MTKSKRAQPINEKLQLITVLLCAMLAGHVRAIEKQVLRGVGIFEETRFNGLNHGISYAGGADAMIFGSGMQMQPADNLISLSTSALTTASQTFQCPALNNLDEFHSKTVDGRLYYRIPSAVDLTGSKVSINEFKAWNEVKTQLTIQSGEDTLECASAANCQVTYKWSHTPIWYYLSSPIMYSGKDVSLYLNPRKGVDFKLNDKMAVDITLEGTRFLTTEYDTDWTMGNKFQSVHGTVRSKLRTNNAELEVWFRSVGNALMKEESAVTCNWDATDCYFARIYPHIDNISEISGSANGGQQLVIEGGDFKHAKTVEVTVDGVPCKVSATTENSITCETGPKTLEAPQLGYAGEHGLYRQYDGKRELLTSAEIPQTSAIQNSASLINGYYEAPVDGLYQFHMSCDDSCTLKLSLTDSVDPAQAEELIKRGSHSSWRDFYKPISHYDTDILPNNDNIGKIFSKWTRLVGGQKYYFESNFGQGGGDAHWTVGVEITPDAPVSQNHRNLRPGRQGIFIHQDLSRDTSQLRIKAADGGTYRLLMLKQDLKYFKSDLIDAGCSAGTLKNKVKGYYKNQFGVDPSVSLECELNDMSLTSDCTHVNVTEHIYTITVPKSISRASSLQVTPYFNTTLSEIDWVYSDTIQLSNPPLTGKYFLECYDTELNPYFTDEFNWNANADHIYNGLVKACPWLRDSVSVWDGFNYYHRQDGLDFIFRFHGVKGPLSQFKLHSSVDSPLVGTGMTIEAVTYDEYGPNVYYDVIPFEQLYTYDTAPAIRATVDGMPVLCKSTMCAYTYEAKDALIQSFSVTGTAVVIDGTMLPTNIASVRISNQECVVSASSDIQIQCDIANPLVAGSWFPEVRTIDGLVTLDTTLLPEEVAIVAVLSQTVFYEEGEDILTIDGSGFPADIVTEDVVLLGFSDGTKCEVISMTATQITCKVAEFETEVLRRNLQNFSFTMSINVRTLAIDVELLAARIKLDSITPASVSPIIPQLLTLQLNSAYDSTNMDLDTFTVGLSTNDPELARPNGDMVRWLNVVDYDKAANTITVKYGGAYTGKYKLILESQLQGQIKTKGKYEVKFEYTDFYPKQGSKYGGQRITIEGGHFSENPKDNPIKIGYEYISGVVHYCDVLSSSDAQITCRMRLDYDRPAGDQELIVFASTYEEAKCKAATCELTFLDTDMLPTIENKFVTYDPTSGKYLIEVNGYDITDVDSTTVQVYIGGVEQTIVSVEPTRVVIQVDEVKSGLINQTFELYFEVGACNGFAELYTEGIELVPEFKGIDTTTVSSKGSTIMAHVAGIGMEDENVTLVDAATGTSICISTQITSYGMLECNTKEMDIITPITLKVMTSTDSYVCNGEKGCTIQTFQIGQPVYSVPIVDTMTTIKLFGTDLNLPGLVGCIIVQGTISADNCVLDVNGDAIGTYNMGVPSTLAPEHPTLIILTDNAGVLAQHKASYTQGVDTLNNTFVTPGAQQDISCSFVGGCQFQIASSGLTSNVLGGIQKVTVCGNEAQLVSQASGASLAVFETPELVTSASETSAGRSDPVLLTPRNDFASLASMEGVLFDGLNVPGMLGTSNNCFVGVKYDAGKKGILSEVRFFMDYFADNFARYNDKLKFQGSNDDFIAEIIDIVTVGNEIHEGWNSYSLMQPNYSSYRLFNVEENGCNGIGELKFYGQEVFDNNMAMVDCTVEIIDVNAQTSTAISQVIEYDLSITTYVNEIFPRYGSVEGGTELTISGTNFNTNTPADVTVLIDGIDCDVTLVNANLIQCTTGPRPGLYLTEPSLVVSFANRGKSDVSKNIFRYMSLWSEDSTWGGQFAPVDGESVAVPKGLNLLVDIDSSPILNMVLVNGGSIVFPSDNDPNHMRTFDAKIIFVNNGVFEAGTEADPYTSKLTITMHGVKYDPTLPIYGNKVLGVRYSTLDLHGVARDSWTSLETTAAAGESSIMVQGEVDWKVGETIMITSTGFDRYEAEEHIISAVTASVTAGGDASTTLTLSEALAFEHHASKTTYGAGTSAFDTVEIRAEVALMERNIIFQGDDESMRNDYGAHILIHAPGDNSNIGRIENVQFQNVGQFGQLGRYPVHFHMDGIVHESYVKNNVFLNSVNRGTTLHGVEYLQIIRNVYYNTKGHTIFVEDGVETKNRVEYNLVINTEPSFSLLNTDSTPACFWLTNPDNILIGNHCAGSEHYGFWYDLVGHPTGPSVTSSRCPINEKLGQFTGNVAHSMPNYGLRIFHGHSPRTQPCSGISDSNPTIQAYYENFLGYKAGRNGVIGGNFGAVTLQNIQVVDNGLAGIEYEKTLGVEEGVTMVKDSLVVGRSNDNWTGENSSPHGIISPRTDKSVFSNIHFHNFDFNNAAAIGTCSHCYSKPSTDSDGRTVKTELLEFTNVDKRVRYQYPFRGIINDLDGSLTEKGPDSWATAFWQHNAAQVECTTTEIESVMFDGLLCDSTVQVRRIVMYGYAPGSLKQRNLFLLPYDDSIVGVMDEAQLIAYEADDANYSIVDWREKKNPSEHWCVPYVTGKKYYVRWEHGLDFEKMKFEIIPWLWDETDLDIEFEMPHYDVREAVYVDDNQGLRIENNTIAAGTNSFGNNLVRNDTETRRINMIINGDNNDINRMTLTGIRCIGGCTPDVPEEIPLEDRIRYWSVLADWDGRSALPVDGDEVIIPSNWQMMYDITVQDTPKLLSLEINGRLTFMPGEDRKIMTYNFWVRAGELNIGSESQPFPNQATIELQGDNTEEYFAFTKAIEAGNKNLVITGTVNMYGMSRDSSSRLLMQAYVGQTGFLVDPNLDWQSGEQLVLAPTNMRTLDTEICTIQSYNSASGEVECEDALKGFHFGADQSTEATYGVDMRGEVALLNRTIEITASQEDISHTLREAWGCRILISDFFENNDAMTLRTGTLQMDNVSVYKCGQKFTWKSAIKFENAIMGIGGSQVANSVIHQGKSPGIIITKSNNITLKNNVIADFAEHGVWVKNSQDVSIQGNWVFGVIENMGKEPKMLEYLGWVGGMTLSEGNNKMVVKDNIVAGTWHHGYHIVPKKCANDNGNFIFKNNVAHSISGYGVIALNVANDCSTIQDFTAYKVTEATIMIGGPSAINRGKNIRSIDTRYGIGVFSAGGGQAQILDSFVYGELADNMDCPQGSPCDHCMSTRGVLLNQNAESEHKDREPDWKHLPLFEKAGSMKGGQSKYRNLRLVNFTTATKTCGARQAAIMPFLAPDYTPFAEFTDLIFDNVAREALTFIEDPPQKWANIQDCVEFTCTGMYNIVMHFDQVQSVGINTPFVPSKFTIISDNKESTSAQAIPTCQKVDQWNAWQCSTDNIGVMIFDNRDPDRMDRSLHPVYIQNEDLGFNNRLNSYMDHCWDGFYTCQKRESRFPTLVYTEVDYNIEFTGTPPASQEFRLFGLRTQPGFVVTIKYNASGAYQLYDQNKAIIMPTDWDAKARTWAAPTGQYCGEWRFEGVINRLQFYIRNFERDGCVIYIMPRDAIMLGIRMEFTLDEFFAEGGVVTFMDKMAAVLGIHRADIKVVSVYEGSTIVEFQVLQRDEEIDGEELIDLKKIDQVYRDFIVEEDNFMDSRILSAQIEGIPILTPYQQEENDKFDWNMFQKDVVEQESKHNKDTGVQTTETTGSTTTKIVTKADGTKTVVTVDESGKVVTQMKKIIIEEAVSPVDQENAYLVLCFVIIVAIIAIMGLICIVKRCGGKNVRSIAQSVDQKVQGEPIKGDFLDIQVADLNNDQQYRPRATSILKVDPARHQSHLSQNSPRTVVDTARELLSQNEVASVPMNEFEGDVQSQDLQQKPRSARTTDTYQ